jgi:ketosteroid isomerase-like protein
MAVVSVWLDRMGNTEAADFDDLDEVLDRIHLALDAFFTGDPEPAKAAYSHREDVSLANPFGAPVVGWDAVSAAMQRAAAHYRDGRVTSFERIARYATRELAYIVEIEHYVAKVGGADRESPVALRVTTVLRREGAAWKIVHRHADPITTPQAAETVIGKSG